MPNKVQTIDSEIDAALGVSQATNDPKKGIIERYLGGLAEVTIDPLVAADKAAAEELQQNPFLGPSNAMGLTLLKGLARSQFGQLQQAGEIAGERGKSILSPTAPVEAQGRLLAGITPVAGPMAARLGESIGQGDIAGAFGQATGILATLAIPLAGKFKTTTPTTVVAEQTLKAIKPRVSVRVKVQQSIPKALEDPAFTDAVAAKPVESLGDLIVATKKARLTVGKELGNEIAAGGQAGLVIDGAGLVKTVKDAIPKHSRITDASAVGKIERGLDKNLGNRQLTIEEAENLRQGLNAELGYYFRKGGSAQRESAEGAGIAHKLALRDALEKSIDSKLESIGGKASTIRKRYSTLRSLEDAANDRFIAEITKEYPDLLKFESLDTLTAGSAMASFLSGQARLGLGLLKVVGSRRLIDVLVNKWRAPDHVIRRAFSNFGKQPKGKPLVTPTRAALAYLAGQEESPEEEK